MNSFTAVLAALVALAPLCLSAEGPATNVRPGNPDWPVAWVSYTMVDSWEKDFADLKAHGVGLVSMRAEDVETAKKALDAARRHGMKYHISFPEVTESLPLVRAAGFEPTPALMIGGVYRGKAIDRHVYRFEPRPQSIVIEQPVYSPRYAYRLGGGGTERGGEPMGHYYLDMPEPVRAEVVVALRKFDGRQHLKIIPAKIEPAEKGARLEADSITPDMPPTSEQKNRKLYRLTFDLTGLGSAMLDQVGIAVYWPYHGSPRYWMFHEGAVSAAAESTAAALRAAVRKTLGVWTEANGGKFPSREVIAARYGDECFYVTGHTSRENAGAVSYPLWDYSAPAVASFRALAGGLEYPRTWGFPEIYGADSYACWLYNLHAKTAALAAAIRDEVSRYAPGLLIFRNTTRAGVFQFANAFDGSGAELLTANLDIGHLDPYPIGDSGYNAGLIPRDMSYYAGLTRRYKKLLIPWMQGFVNTMTVGERHATPELLDRMAEQQLRHGVDAVIWLSYGQTRSTFPKARTDTWERAAEFHRRLAASPPAKPKAVLAVLRPYSVWAQSSLSGDRTIRNPADWMLQQWLEVWAVKHKRDYDVFELPPRMSAAARAALDRDLKSYRYVVSLEPRQGAWVVGEGTSGTAVDQREAAQYQSRFEAEMVKRGWLGNPAP